MVLMAIGAAVSWAQASAPVRLDCREIPYDDTALERCLDAIQALKLENVEVQSLALGLRAYWSVRAQLESDFHKVEPDTMRFVADKIRGLHLDGVPLLLDVFAHHDSVRPCCGAEGSRLAALKETP